jgi:hypothetical protein
MTMLTRFFAMTTALLLGTSVASAATDAETIDLFKHAGESAVFFKNC